MRISDWSSDVCFSDLAAIEGTDLASKPLEEIVHHAEGSGNKGLFNNAAQAWNHAFYWESLSPAKTEPTGDLLAAIERAFGSLDDLTKKLKETRSEEHTSELQSLMRISYAVFCLKKKKAKTTTTYSKYTT